MALPGQSPVPPADGIVTDERLAALLGLGAEYDELDFKRVVVLAGRRGGQAEVELAEDVGAMQVKGGYIVIGVDAGRGVRPATIVPSPDGRCIRTPPTAGSAKCLLLSTRSALARPTEPSPKRARHTSQQKREKRSSGLGSRTLGNKVNLQAKFWRMAYVASQSERLARARRAEQSRGRRVGVALLRDHFPV